MESHYYQFCLSIHGYRAEIGLMVPLDFFCFFNLMSFLPTLRIDHYLLIKIPVLFNKVPVPKNFFTVSNLHLSKKPSVPVLFFNLELMCSFVNGRVI